MKPVSLLAAILLAGAPLVHAVELNKDALKAMQEEGHKIVEEAQGGRVYRTNNGLCLDIAGAGLVVRQCNDAAATQKWRTDDKKHLVASDKRCVAGAAQLQKCGAVAEQQYQMDAQKRLVNGLKKCLQVQGSPIVPGAKVVAAPCSGAVNQVWN